MRENNNDLWRDFRKTATEFEARFATEEDCRAYWIQARWGGKPACARCNSARMWTDLSPAKEFSYSPVMSGAPLAPVLSFGTFCLAVF